MRIKNLILLTIATLCCTTALAGTTAAVVEKHYNDSIREGQTYLFYDYFVTEPGTYNNLLHGVGGHDDLLVYLHLNVLPACTDIEVSYTDSIVLGESYLLANKIITPTEVGTLHEQTIIARASGCDSTINLTLKVLEPCSDITVAYTDSIVLGETYLFIDQFITPTEVGTVNASAIIPRVAGCDSTINLTLKVLEPCSDITVAYTDSIVLGETYLFIDQFITPTEVGTVNASATIPRVAGCDSTINLTLKVLEPCSDITVAYTDSIVLGETYLFIDQFITPTEVGTVNASATIPRVAGCDSTINLTLKVLEPCSDITVAYTDSIVLGETYLFIDQFITPTEVGTVTASATIPRVAGCDSTINLTLKVLEPCSDITVAYTDSIVLGETYLFIDQFITPTEVGSVTASATIPRVAGCDSTINLTLKVLEPCSDITVAYTDSIVLGETYLFIDQFITPTEVGTVNASATIPRVAGCDSTINLTLKVLEPCSDITVAYTDSIVLGETYLFIDQFITPTEVGTVTASATIPRVAGCDSTINLTLKVLPDCEDVEVAYTDSIYLGETYLFVDQMITPTVAGTTNHQAILPREGCSCDSIINLSLIAMRIPVADTLYDTTAINRCYKEEFVDRLDKKYYPTQDTTVLDTIRAARQEITDTTIITYDSIYVFNLKVWPAMTTTNQTDSLCADYGSFTWNLGSRDSVITDFMAGENHREYMYQNILGCDSAKFVLDVTVWPAMTTTTQTDSLCADYGSFTWNLGSRDSIITDFVTGVNHREYMYQNILGCDSAKFVLDVTVWPAMTTTTQTDSLCADYGSFTWNLGSRDSIITDFMAGENHREYMYKNILGGDSAKFVLDVTVWPATEYPTAVKDTIDEDKFPYMWNVYEGRQLAINAGGQHFDTVQNILHCDSIIYELDLAVRTVERREAALIEDYVCKGTEYHGRLTNHVINDLTEWQDSLRIWDNDLLLAIDSIYTYKIDTLPTRIPDDQITGIKAFCDYPVDYSYAWLNVAEFVAPSFIFAQVTDTIWEVETKNGWNPAATTILTSEDKTIRVRCTVVTECETTYSTSEPYEVKMATADDKEELIIPATQKYGSRIIMIDKKATEDLGWTIPEADVTWYQVVDEPDDRSYDSNPATWNDKKVGEGQYYYTLDNGDPITGQYYAIVTGATKGEKMTCGAELRTPVLVCNQESNAPTLAPNLVAPNESMTLSGLDATQNYTIRVISMDGNTVNNFNVSANERVDLKAASVQGMYIVNVWNGQENVSLKYIVK